MRNSYFTNLNLPKTDFALLLFRIAIGGMMLVHGIPKLLQLFSGEEIVFADPIGIGATATLALSVIAEVICSVLIIIGLGTRLAVIPLIINMAVAVLIFHATDGFQAQELGALYLICYLVLFYTGSGKYSFDYRFLKK
ncbi:DoxX family protein [Mesonia sp.]|uniref:DoxX family protein n=1 Tax=Mesonia sp. TaxID=1960830 RepID=UPI003F9E85E4